MPACPILMTFHLSVLFGSLSFQHLISIMSSVTSLIGRWTKIRSNSVKGGQPDLFCEILLQKINS